MTKPGIVLKVKVEATVECIDLLPPDMLASLFSSGCHNFFSLLASCLVLICYLCKAGIKYNAL